MCLFLSQEKLANGRQALFPIFFLLYFSVLFSCTDDYCNQQPDFHLKLVTFIAISALYCGYLRTLLLGLYVEITLFLPKMENVRVKWTIFCKDLYSFHFYQILFGPSNQESWDGRTHVVLHLCHTPRFTPIQYVLKRFTFLGFFSVFSSVQFRFLRACYQSQLHELYHIWRRLIIFILWFCSSCCNCYKHEIRIMWIKPTCVCKCM